MQVVTSALVFSVVFSLFSLINKDLNHDKTAIEKLVREEF